MNVNIQTVHFDADQKLVNYVNQKLEKLTQFHDRIAGSKLVMLDGLGHVPMEEDPAASVAPVKAFIDSL